MLCLHGCTQELSTQLYEYLNFSFFLINLLTSLWSVELPFRFQKSTLLSHARIRPSIWPILEVSTVHGLMSKFWKQPDSILLCENSNIYKYLHVTHSFPCGLCSNEGRRFRLPPNFPVRFHPSDAIEFGSDKKVDSLTPLIVFPLLFSLTRLTSYLADDPADR
jgi:hypothetical protein